MNLGLADAAVVVTGAASGIGLSTVAVLVDEGAAVTALDRVEAKELPAGFPAAGVRCAYSKVDVTVPGAVRKCLEGRNVSTLRGVVLCAAEGPFCEDPVRVVRTNYLAAVENVLSLVDRMEEWSSVVMLSSTAAYRERWGALWEPLVEEAFGRPRDPDLWDRIGALSGSASYALSKWAVNRGFVRLARQLADRHVRVNCVVPGPTRTPMGAPLWEHDEVAWRKLVAESPFGRCNSAEEVACVVAALVASQTRMVQGSFLHVDGGWHGVHASPE